MLGVFILLRYSMERLWLYSGSVCAPECLSLTHISVAVGAAMRFPFAMGEFFCHQCVHVISVTVSNKHNNSIVNRNMVIEHKWYDILFRTHCVEWQGTRRVFRVILERSIHLLRARTRRALFPLTISDTEHFQSTEFLTITLKTASRSAAGATCSICLKPPANTTTLSTKRPDVSYQQCTPRIESNKML